MEILKVVRFFMVIVTIIHIVSFNSLFITLEAAAPQNPQPGDARDIKWWCSTTPHPESCNYFMGHHAPPRCRADFRVMAVKVAMERALREHKDAKKLRKRCHSKRKKAAWRDCVKLYDDTIYQLNRTLQRIQANKKEGTLEQQITDKHSDFDTQTWLSAAMTNLETCYSGSVELNVSSFISPIISGNVSDLISNSLAINNDGVLLGEKQKELINGGYPSWITAGERKLLESQSLTAAKANYVVARNGSGMFRSIQAAIDHAASRRKGNGRIVIYVKRGVYRENILVGNNVNNIMLVGDGLRYTIITGSRSVNRGFTTYSTATVGVDGAGFMARGITFRNTAGPRNCQAVALRSGSDHSVFYACSFEGYQDTLFVYAQRQFYKSCYIYGTIDFIFGNAAVVFQNCIIYVRRPLHGQDNVITAQGRIDPFQNTGISIHNSRVLAAPDLQPVVRAFRTYLGRPWQQYSRTVFLKTYLDRLVHPTGWLAWQNTSFGLDSLYYGEFKNFGPGSSTRYRVKWRGYHAITSSAVASRFTVNSLIAGRSWLPSTGVPFIAGL